MAEYDVQFEEEVKCPKCGHTHIVKGTATVEIEPERDESRD